MPFFSPILIISLSCSLDYFDYCHYQLPQLSLFSFSLYFHFHQFIFISFHFHFTDYFYYIEL